MQNDIKYLRKKQILSDTKELLCLTVKRLQQCHSNTQTTSPHRQSSLHAYNQPWIATQSGVVQRVEAVIVCDGQVCMVFQEQGNHVVPLLADSVVEWGISLRILNTCHKIIKLIFRIMKIICNNTVSSFLIHCKNKLTSMLIHF